MHLHLKRYWRAIIVLLIVFIISCLLPILEVRNPTLTMLVVIIVACYFIAVWAYRPVKAIKEELDD